MAQTKEEKALYCREWRVKNRERYLASKKRNYHKNKDGFREQAKARAKAYYYKVMRPKRKENPEFYRALDRIQSVKMLEKRRNHLRDLRNRMGGKCTDCGYCEVVGILQFHHDGREKKESNVSELQSYKKREEEAKKCILLCPNCHALRHFKKNDNS